jgi:hypothetical protein
MGRLIALVASSKPLHLLGERSVTAVASQPRRVARMCLTRGNTGGTAP